MTLQKPLCEFKEEGQDLKHAESVCRLESPPINAFIQTIKCNLVHGVYVFTHVALLRDGVLVFEGMVGKLRGVVGRRVSVVCASIKSNCAVTCMGQII